jgi:hypothetical protein
MTPEYFAQVSEWCQGHAPAVDFLRTAFGIFHLVDDVTDGDKKVSVRDIQQGFIDALITLPRNPFYQAHFADLNLCLQQAVINWQAANRMEVTEAANSKEVAYVLRSSYNDLITLCAFIIGGQDWAVKVAFECRLRASKEGYAQYLEQLKDEKRPTYLVGE